MNITVLRPNDAGWPHKLSELEPHDPPEQLFATGQPLAIAERTVAIVGTRRPTAAGIETAERFATAFAEAGFAVVSGLAVGIDAAAHRAALRAGGYTVAVLGCGLDVDYPRNNRALRRRIEESGTVVSEYPSGTEPHPHHFPLRNRIIAGLAQGVVVVEGGIKSGALITARIAVDINRHVWALPGSIRNPVARGPNELIRVGNAALVTDVQQIFDELAPGLVWVEGVKTKKTGVVLGDDEQSLLRLLDDVPVSTSWLASLSDLKPGRLAVTLSRLEVRGLVRKRAGGYEISEAGARARAGMVS